MHGAERASLDKSAMVPLPLPDGIRKHINLSFAPSLDKQIDFNVLVLRDTNAFLCFTSCAQTEGHQKQSLQPNSCEANQGPL